MKIWGVLHTITATGTRLEIQLTNDDVTFLSKLHHYLKRFGLSFSFFLSIDCFGCKSSFYKYITWELEKICLHLSERSAISKLRAELWTNLWSYNSSKFDSFIIWWVAIVVLFERLKVFAGSPKPNSVSISKIWVFAGYPRPIYVLISKIWGGIENTGAQFARLHSN